MTTYDTLLAPLDKKWGRPVTMQDWAAVGRKHVSDLSDDDLLIVEAFDSRAQRDALEAARDRWMKPLPPPAAPVVMTKSTAAPPMPVSGEWLAKAIVDGFAPTFKSYKTKIAALEQEIEKLKARPLQKWAGIHVAGVPYAEASLVTKAGSLWVSVTQTDTTPGDPGSDWRLIVKRGDVR